jgi:hypothetical protein
MTTKDSKDYSVSLADGAATASPSSINRADTEDDGAAQPLAMMSKGRKSNHRNKANVVDVDVDDLDYDGDSSTEQPGAV